MRQIILILGLVLSSSFFNFEAQAQHTRRTNPNVFAVEGLGRGGLGSLQFDRVVSDDVSAGFGIGLLGSAGVSTFFSVPFFMNYYLNRDARSFYVTGGATVSFGSGGLISSIGNFGSAVLPNFGLGYESRSDSGFLFRAAAYGMISTVFAPWFGFTFGYAI
ncbi:MAG: hypothetical protein KA715_13325 [Xanthomonadaceae bacterium]|nr:hypothetical protein [Xanthomonadaceae bacterium]